MSTIPLRVKKLSELATIPLRGSPGAAGLDLSSAHDTVIPARGKGIVKTWPSRSRGTATVGLRGWGCVYYYCRLYE